MVFCGRQVADPEVQDLAGSNWIVKVMYNFFNRGWKVPEVDVELF